jgi:glycosyltransferase involved in cell wall biosynthesis
VTVIVPVRNGARFVPTCLQSIGADPYPDGYREILVADNGSTDGSAALAESLGARVLSKPGLAVSWLRNEAVKASSGELLAFIDVDHEIDGGWLSAALDALRDPSVAAAGAPCHPPRNATWVQTMYDAMRDHVESPVDTRWLGAGNFVVRRDAFEGVGGFDAALETCEDVDLCQRLRRSGVRLVNTPYMVNRHFGDPATLSALFRGELWRGRDNLRVSLRGPLSWRDLPSIAVPILWLVVIALVAGALWSGSPLAAGLAATGLGGLALASVARAAGMIRRRGFPAGVQWAQALVVALVYDLARAVSLVVRASHRTRQTVSA